MKTEDHHDTFPEGKYRGESSASPARKKKPHERPQSCRMSYAKQTIQRWRSLVEQAYDSKSGWEWKQDRRTWDRLEALTLMCFNANRSRRFMLTRYLKEFAMYFGFHPRTIRRALADGCYWRGWTLRPGRCSTPRSDCLWRTDSAREVSDRVRMLRSSSHRGVRLKAFASRARKRSGTTPMPGNTGLRRRRCGARGRDLKIVRGRTARRLRRSVILSAKDRLACVIQRPSDILRAIPCAVPSDGKACTTRS